MKKILLLLITLLIIIGISPSAYADAPDIPAKAAFAVEVSTGKILYAKNANESLPIASLTKLLTMYLVYQEISEGRLSWETPIPISDYAYRLVTNPNISNPPMAQKDYTVKQLVEASLVVSANSASIALAEKIAGSESAFVDRMIALLDNWGIQNYRLVNVTGLNNQALPAANRYPNSAETDENHMSAKDIAIVAYHLVTDFPQVLDITKQSHLDFDGNQLTSSNHFLTGLKKARASVDGLKTGTTELAGQSLITTSTENGMRLLTVLLNAEQAEENPLARFDATTQLLDYLGSAFSLQTVWAKDTTFPQQRLTISYGTKDQIAPIAGEDLKIVTPKTKAIPNQLVIKPSPDLEAPISKNQLLGSAHLIDNNLIGDGYLISQPEPITIRARTRVERQSDWDIWWQKLLKALSFSSY